MVGDMVGHKRYKVMHKATCIYDIPEWVDIKRVSTQADYKAFKAIYLSSFGSNLRRRIRILLKKREVFSTSFVWLYKGDYIGIYTLQDNESKRVTPEVNFKVLYNFALKQDMRGKGFGRIMLASAITETAKLGYSELLLTVATDNIAALKLYQHEGFKHINQEK